MKSVDIQIHELMNNNAPALPFQILNGAYYEKFISLFITTKSGKYHLGIIAW